MAASSSLAETGEAVDIALAIAAKQCGVLLGEIERRAESNTARNEGISTKTRRMPISVIAADAE
jgi:hypothetical protein